jgi:hypothetical protein
MWYFLHDPEGKRRVITRLNTEIDESHKENHISNLNSGVYELILLGFYKSRDTSNYDLSIEFNSIERLSGGVLSENHNEIRIINQFSNIKNYSVEGQILGYEQFHTARIMAGEESEIPATFIAGDRSKTFEVTLSADDFNKVTDFALMVYDNDGLAKGVSGLSYREGSVSINNTFKTDSTTLRFVMIPGFTHGEGELFAHIDEKTYLKNEISFKVTSGAGSRVKLYPGIEETIKCVLNKPEINIPEGTKYFGKILFKSDDKLIFEMPVKFSF